MQTKYYISHKATFEGLLWKVENGIKFIHNGEGKWGQLYFQDLNLKGDDYQILTEKEAKNLHPDAFPTESEEKPDLYHEIIRASQEVISFHEDRMTVDLCKVWLENNSTN